MTNWIQVAQDAKVEADKEAKEAQLRIREERQQDEQEALAVKWSEFTESLTRIVGLEAAQEILAGERKVTKDSPDQIRLKSNGKYIQVGDPYVWSGDFQFRYSQPTRNLKGEASGWSFYLSHREDDAWPNNYNYSSCKTLRTTKIHSAAELGLAVTQMTKTYDELVAAFPAWQEEQERIKAEEKRQEELREVARAWNEIFVALRNKMWEIEQEREDARAEIARTKRVAEMPYTDRRGYDMLKTILHRVENGEELRPDEQAVWGLAVYTQNLESAEHGYEY